MLASIGIFAETNGRGVEEYTNQRRFELTPMASLLLSETKDSVRNFALLFGLESFKKAIDDVLYSIETGESSFKHANGLDMYEYMQQNQKRCSDLQWYNDLTHLIIRLINLFYVWRIALYARSFRSKNLFSVELMWKLKDLIPLKPLDRLLRFF